MRQYFYDKGVNMDNLSNKYIGKTINKLTVCNIVKKNNRLYFNCICECGKSALIRTDAVISGKTKSCGCLKGSSPKRFTNISRKDYHKLQSTWFRINYRCHNKNHHKYPFYGAKGIYVCDQWRNSLDDFILWSINNGYSYNLTIDRIDNSKGYSPENCRWATLKQQQRNRNVTKMFTYNNVTKPISEWCEILNLPYDATKERLKHGWSMEKCISTPIRNYKSKI